MLFFAGTVCKRCRLKAMELCPGVLCPDSIAVHTSTTVSLSEELCGGDAPELVRRCGCWVGCGPWWASCCRHGRAPVPPLLASVPPPAWQRTPRGRRAHPRLPPASQARERAARRHCNLIVLSEGRSCAVRETVQATALAPALSGKRWRGSPPGAALNHDTYICHS